MASAELESTAEFVQRSGALGISSTNVRALVDAGFDTFGKFAFSVPYTPGSSDESPLVDWLTRTLGGPIDPAQLACLRRLFWESHALALGDLKQRQEHGSEGVSKKLPTSERVARSNEQRKRLKGVVWGADTEPSHQLVDRFVAMVEENAVTYVRPELCTSRTQEVSSVKQVKSFSLGADGNLKVQQKSEDFECSTSGELRLRSSFQRKSLAMDQAHMVSFAVAEQWHTYLFMCLQREPPKGFRAVTISQLLEADKRMWVLIAEESRGNVAAKISDSCPCDAILTRLSSSQEVLAFLTPLPEAPPSSRWEPYPTKGKGGKGKDKDKGKGKSKQWQGSANQWSLPLPAGAKTHTEDGKPLCQMFNKGKCWHTKTTKPGKRCVKGFHKCWICLRDRPATECTHTD